MNDDAETARSILACPKGAELIVEGVRQPLDDLPDNVRDRAGTPMIICLPGSPPARAGELGREAVLSLRSGLRPTDSVSLAGPLRHLGSDECPCCAGTQEYVIIKVADVVLSRDGIRVPVDLKAFSDPALMLNSGYLRRGEQHLNRCHGEHLRQAIAWRTGGRLDTIVAAQILTLTSTGVELQYITADGSHILPVDFPDVARDTEELAHFLRRALHPDLC